MRTKQQTAVMIVLCAMILPCINAGARADDIDLDAIRSTLTQLAQRELDSGVASISIALVKDGEVVLTDAWGYANNFTKAEATPETLYCTGSTFKAVTATAILQLAEQGKLSLDDPANDHLGEHQITADTDNRVTIRHLLDHTSGLSAGAATEDIWSRTLPTKLEDIPAMFTIASDPDTEWVYNNQAYAVAGLIVEKVSGQSYEKYIVEHVLEPLGIETPGPVHPTAAMLERMALPYVVGPSNEPRPVPYVHYDVYPAGDIYLTAEDMARFLAVHLNGGTFDEARILAEESVERAHTPNMNNYGLGWIVSRPGGRTVISHGGGVPGFLTQMMGSVDDNVGAYVMSNSGNMGAIAQAAVRMLAGEEYAPPAQRKEVGLQPDVMQEYVGVYQLAGLRYEIFLDDGQLSARLTGQQRLPIFAEAKDKLFYKIVDAQLSVVRDDEGEVTAVILHQNGIDQRAERIDEPAPSASEGSHGVPLVSLTDDSALAQPLHHIRDVIDAAE